MTLVRYTPEKEETATSSNVVDVSFGLWEEEEEEQLERKHKKVAVVLVVVVVVSFFFWGCLP